MGKDLPPQLIQSIFAKSPLGVYQTTPDGKIIAANKAFLSMLDIHPKNTTKTNLNKHPFGAVYPRQEFKRLIEEKKEVVGLEYPWKKKSGETLYVRENAHLVRDALGKPYYVGTVEDITDRKKVELELLESKQKLEEVQGKLSFLLETTRRMSKSVGFTSRLKTFAHLVVPEMADWCAIDILSNGTLETVALHHLDPQKIALAKRYKQLYPPDPNRNDGIWNVLRTGEILFRPTIADTLLKSRSQNNKQAQILSQLGMSSLIVLPLIARGKTFGAITLVNTPKRGSFSRSDLAFAQVFTTRAAILADNARLFVEAQKELDQRKQIEKVLRERAQKHHAIFNNTLDPILITSDEGTLLEANKAAKKIFGLQRTNFFELLVPEQKKRMHPRWKSLLRKGKLRGQTIVVGSDGQKYEIEYSAVANVMLGNHVIVLRDISAQREEERRRDHFLGIASHEMKNALAGIKSFTQLLQRKLQAEENIKGYVRRIDINADRLHRLMEDLMDLTRLKSKKLKLVLDTFEINQLVREITEEIQMASPTHHIILKLGQPLFISADRMRIRQVLTNLIKNAIKYSPDAKKIIVSTHRERGMVKVSVQDFGIGISKEDQKKIFELFYRVEDSGTMTSGLGIGLYISSEIVKMHGGRTNVISQKAKGSTFSFTLPI